MTTLAHCSRLNVGAILRGQSDALPWDCWTQAVALSCLGYAFYYLHSACHSCRHTACPIAFILTPNRTPEQPTSQSSSCDQRRKLKTRVHSCWFCADFRTVQLLTAFFVVATKNDVHNCVIAQKGVQCAFSVAAQSIRRYTRWHTTILSDI